MDVVTWLLTETHCQLGLSHAVEAFICVVNLPVNLCSPEYTYGCLCCMAVLEGKITICFNLVCHLKEGYHPTLVQMQHG